VKSLWGYSRRLKGELKTFYHRDLNNFLSREKNVRCPICGWEGKRFHDLDCGFGHIYRNSECPSCKSQPRHRSFCLYFRSLLDQGKEMRLLHFAPEPCLTDFFKTFPKIEYLSVDINESSAMQKEDITSLSFGDSTFDMVFCSHVLEHIEDDRKAMAELLRVLKKGGFAVIDVPIDFDREQTHEDPSITSEEERTREFWQHDHVRLYGRDFPEKLRRVGFEVKADEFIHSLGESEIETFGLQNTPIYLCTK
jgi:SAM-dependent methyltransferase